MPQYRLITATLLLLLASVSSHAAGKGGSGFQCWTNHQGVRECGNVVPPEYAQGRTESVNKQGMVTKVDERAKTAAELAEEERKLGDTAARAAEEKRKQKDQEAKQAEQAKYDRMLKASYFREEDIEAARKRKLGGFDASIELTRTTITKLEEKLAREEQLAANAQKSAKPGSHDRQKDIDELKKQISDKQAFVAAKEQEKSAVNAEYDGYLKRFRELKGTSAR